MSDKVEWWRTVKGPKPEATRLSDGPNRAQLRHPRGADSKHVRWRHVKRLRVDPHTGDREWYPVTFTEHMTKPNNGPEIARRRRANRAGRRSRAANR